MKSSGMAVLMVWATTLVAGEVAAQEIDNIGNAGQIVISAEHLAGVFATRTEEEINDTDSTGATLSSKSDTTRTTISVFGNNAAGLTGLPRLALDFFVAQGFSIGGALMYLTSSGDSESEATVTVPGVGSQTATSDTTLPTQTYFVIAPRIGYAYAFDETFAVWPRVGFSYSSLVVEDEDEVTDPTTGEPTTVTDTVTLKSTNLTLELLLAVSPFSHFALFGGPYFDVGLGGSSEYESDAPGVETVEGDVTFSSYGFTVGILAYF